MLRPSFPALPEVTPVIPAVPEMAPMSKKALAKASKPGPTALPPGKNAVQFLNEQMPGLPFECVSRAGTDNKPTFTMKVITDGQAFFLSRETLFSKGKTH